VVKRIVWLLVGIALFVAALAWADAEKGKAAAAPKPQTLTGEIVDMGCFVEHGAKGEKHVGCASKCIAGGMPMGLLTTDGKLYLITLDHDNADPYNQCKDWAAKQVTLTGTIAERSGVRAIDVTGAQLVAAK
jgi:hypothetical protein